MRWFRSEGWASPSRARLPWDDGGARTDACVNSTRAYAGLVSKLRTARSRAISVPDDLRDDAPIHGTVSLPPSIRWSGEQVPEFATLTYVDWFNNRRLHGEIEPGPGYTTPAAFEAAWHEANKRAMLTSPESSSDEPGDTNHPDETTAHAADTQTNEPL